MCAHFRVYSTAYRCGSESAPPRARLVTIELVTLVWMHKRCCCSAQLRPAEKCARARVVTRRVRHTRRRHAAVPFHTHTRERSSCEGEIGNRDVLYNKSNYSPYFSLLYITVNYGPPHFLYRAQVTADYFARQWRQAMEKIHFYFITSCCPLSLKFTKKRIINSADIYCTIDCTIYIRLLID